jgi:hypothetical protein
MRLGGHRTWQYALCNQQGHFAREPENGDLEYEDQFGKAKLPSPYDFQLNRLAHGTVEEMVKSGHRNLSQRVMETAIVSNQRNKAVAIPTMQKPIAMVEAQPSQ